MREQNSVLCLMVYEKQWNTSISLKGNCIESVVQCISHLRRLKHQTGQRAAHFNVINYFGIEYLAMQEACWMLLVCGVQSTLKNDIVSVNDHLIVSTLDGNVYYVEKHSGKIKWKIQSGGDLILSPRSKVNMGKTIQFLPNVDGNVISIQYDRDGKVHFGKKTSIPVKELVNRSPFLTQDGVLYKGEKRTVLFGVDPYVGKVLYEMSDTEDQCSYREGTSVPFILGRYDYVVKAYDAKTGVELYNFSYGQVEIVHSHVDKRAVLPALKVVVDEDGGIEVLNEDGTSKWSRKLSAPVLGQVVQSTMGWENDITRTSSMEMMDYVDHTLNSWNTLLTLPRPLEKGDIDMVQIVEKDAMDYTVCKDDFDCLMRFHARGGDKRNTCPDPKVNFKKAPHQEYAWIAACVVLFVAVVFVFKKIRNRKVFNHHVPYLDAHGNSCVGLIKVSTEVLGYGCHGTVVFSGYLGPRPVAVKRMLRQFHSSANNEIKLLINSDGHPNVVRYYAKEECGDFVYLALEKCQQSLAATISDIQNTRRAHDGTAYTHKQRQRLREFLLKLANGVAHLHQQRIVHRDLKPQNILVVDSSTTDPLGSPKISDMGLGKLLDQHRNSYGTASGRKGASSASSAQSPGTVGWQAPELLRHNGDLPKPTNKRKTAAVDIFALGCVFHTVLLPGKHPFGEWFERERNIILDQAELQDLHSWPLAQELVSKMICGDPEKRFTIHEVLSHPFFWDETRTMSFLLDVSDKVERDDKCSHTARALEIGSTKTVGSFWSRKIHGTLLEEMAQHRSYNSRTVRDLLRLIRNKRHHYHELPSAIQKLLGPIPTEFCDYFVSRFPRLVLHCYNWASKYYADEQAFHPYFGASTKRFLDEIPLSLIGKPHRSWHVSPQEWITQPMAEHDGEISRAEAWAKSNPDLKARTTLCAFWTDSHGEACKYGQTCGFAHGYVEFRLAPSRRAMAWQVDGEVVDLVGISGTVETPPPAEESTANQFFKTRICRFFISPHGCTNGDKCRYLHPGVDDPSRFNEDTTVATKKILEIPTKAIVKTPPRAQVKTQAPSVEKTPAASWPRGCTLSSSAK